jgi:polyisoprenoid-binding protein YceI
MRKTEILRTIIFLTATLCLVACAKDPSKDAVSAKVEEVKPEQAPTAQKVVEPAKEEAGAAGNLSGEVIFVGSKISGVHACKFTDWSGQFTEGKTVEEGTLAITVQTTAMACDFEDPTPWTVKLEKHLRSDDFFASEKFPEATFVSTAIAAKADAEAKTTHTVTGKMNIRGVEKEISFPAVLTAGEEGFKANIEFSLNRKDFGIAYPGKPDDLIRDGVVLKLQFASK